jgi:hypothetical protein
MADGWGQLAKFSQPSAVYAYESSEIIMIADSTNNVVKKATIASKFKKIIFFS